MVKRATARNGTTIFVQLVISPTAGKDLYRCSLREVELDEDIRKPDRRHQPVGQPGPSPAPEDISDPFELIFNLAPVQIAVFDPWYRFLYINPQTVKDDTLRPWLIGKDDFDYCRYRNRDTSLAVKRREKLEAVTRTREPQGWEETHTTHEQKTVIISWTLTPVFDAARNIRMIIATGSDLTLIRNAQRQVREEQEKFMLLARHVKEVFYIRDKALTKFLYVSPSFEQVWGYPCQQLLDDPKTWYRAVHPEDKPRLKDIDVLSSPDRQVNTQFRIIRPDGTERWIQARLFLTFDHQSDLSYVVGFSEDITERKTAELALQNQARQFRDIFENAPIPMAIADMAGKLVLVNEAMGNTLGYTGDELLRSSFNVLSVTEDVQENLLLRQKLLRGQAESIQLNKRFVHKNGQILSTLLKASLMRNSLGQPTHFLGQLVDITDLKKAEEALTSQNRELAKINAELDRFVYSTSHDLRAPLTSLLGLVYLMEQEQKGATIQEYLDMMRTSINRMDAFINEITDYARNARTEVSIEPLDIEQLTGECFQDLCHLPRAASIRRETVVALPEPLHSDGRRLKIVLNNLISNAILYHNPYQSSPFIRVEVTAEGSLYVIRVSDNGKGISTEHQGRIFNMFYRASDETKGSGLGLYIVRETVEKMGGTIEVSSGVGIGSTFTIQLPLRR